MKKVISFLLILVMVGTLVACGNTKQEETKQSGATKESTAASDAKEPTESIAEEVKEPVTITLYPYNANLTSGTVGGWMGEYLLEKGYILDIWSYSSDKLTAILASGDLPDIMFMKKDVVDFAEYGKNGILVNMDDYADKLPNLMGNDEMQRAMNYVREYVTKDGSLRVLPTQVGRTANVTNTERVAVKLNWEVYEEIGTPTFKNLDELIPILKQMQEVHPTSAGGDKTYGMHLYAGNEFDPIMAVFDVIGHSKNYLQYGVEIDLVEEEFNYCLVDDSAYKYALRFINKMYREGLLDPDSMVTERIAQHKKIEGGAALAGWSAVPGWEYSGYYPVWFDEVESVYNMTGYPYGGSAYLCVNAKSENLDAVIDFINLLADPEVQRTLVNGPQGELWDVDASGKAYVTDKGLDWWVNGKEAVLKNGETYSLFNTPLFWGGANLSVDGQLMALNFADEVLAAKDDNEINRKWQKTTGYENYLQMITDKGTFLPESFLTNVSKFSAVASDNQKLIASAVKTAMVNAMWKMIYAESDAQFEEIWDECVAECEGLGIKELFDWQVKELVIAIDKKKALEN